MLHTFVILAHNESDDLEECIKSVINQSTKSNVVIATSTPNDYIIDLASQYSLGVMVNEKKSNKGRDYNFAINSFDTKLVTIAHQDDLYDRNYTKEIIKCYKKNKDATIIFTDNYEIESEKKIKKSKKLFWKRYFLFPLKYSFFQNKKHFKLRALKKDKFICTSSITFVKDNIHEDIFPTNLKYDNDWQGLINLAKKDTKFVYLKKDLVGYRIDNKKNNKKKEREDENILKSFYSKWYYEKIIKNGLKKWIYILILLLLIVGVIIGLIFCKHKTPNIGDIAIKQEQEEEKIDNRYKNYLPFNINIVTKDSFKMYLDDEKILTFNESMEFPIIINNYEGKYYVEYNNRLVSISKDDISKIVESKNTDKKNQSKITTLAYHRVYDTGDKCTDGYICIKKETFDKQMKYLSDNNYFTLNLNELYMYLKGNLQIAKGVVITFDDGYLYKAADEVLSKYNLNGTMFVISGDFSDYSVFKNLKAIDIQSHTHNMHRNHVCAGGSQGGAILCASKENIIKDLKRSIEVLNVDPIAIAYPFYDYNEKAISALKEAGFKMAFTGSAKVSGKSTPKSTNLYKIPRMTVWEESLMSFNKWKSYL